MARQAVAEIRGFARDVGERQPNALHLCRQSFTDSSQLDALRYARDKLGVNRLFEAPEALAERWRPEAENLRGASYVAVLGDNSEVFEVTKLHHCFPHFSTC